MVKGMFKRSLLIGCAVASLSVAAPLPAAAIDDGKGNSFLDVLDLVGLGTKKEEEVIFYRERPPLVLPPKTELRQPLPPAAQRTADWPRDPEAVRAERLNAAGRAKRDNGEDDPAYAAKLTRQGRINPRDAREPAGPGGACSMVPDAPNKCDPTTFWNNLSQKSDSPAEKGLQAGVEPERGYLTNPPKGYMAPNRNVAARSEPASSEEPSIFDYFRPRKTE